MPEIISTAVGRIGGDDHITSGAKRLHNLAYLLFASLVKKKKTALIKETIDLVKKKDNKELLEKIRDEGVPVLHHRPFDVNPRDIAYRFIFDIQDALFYVYSPYGEIKRAEEENIEREIDYITPAGYDAYTNELYRWFDYYRSIFVNLVMNEPRYDEHDFEELGLMIEPEREWIRDISNVDIEKRYKLNIDAEYLF